MNYDGGPVKNKEDDVFMEQFKLYKRKNPPPDLSNVINFGKIFEDVSEVAGEKITRVKLDGVPLGSIEGMKALREWRAYRLERLPGVTFIQNPFLPLYQRYWVWRCLSAYPLRPNVCNLDGDPRFDRGVPGNVWQQAQDHNAKLASSKKDCLLKKLRWVTLGYHYDWTKKVYASAHSSLFPDDLADLSSCLASALGYSDYSPQAAIINYYHSDSTLSGHADHSEFDKRAPLISISFGQSALFMVGGCSRQVRPVAMLLCSGDVVVLADDSRLAYHAVPRVLTDDKHLSCMRPNNGAGLSEACQQKMVVNAWPSHSKCNGGVDCPAAADCGPGCTPGSESGAKRPRLLCQTACGDSISTCECSCSNTLCAGDTTNASSVIGTSVPSTSPDTQMRAGHIRYCVDVLHKVNDESLWLPFRSYMLSSRINMNVRQVAERGKNVEDYC